MIHFQTQTSQQPQKVVAAGRGHPCAIKLWAQRRRNLRRDHRDVRKAVSSRSLNVPIAKAMHQPRAPTNQPINRPSTQATRQQRNQPTNRPINHPTNQRRPTSQPTNQPTNQPINQPSQQSAAELRLAEPIENARAKLSRAESRAEPS